MGQEYFDDAAFYFVVMSVLLTFLVPWTINKVWNSVFAAAPDSGSCKCKSCQAKFAAYNAKNSSIKSKFTVKNIIYVLLWICLFVALSKSGTYQEQELVTFDPYDILGVDSMSTDAEIKKAYRKESLKWHPDKNANDEDAAQKFILVSKAYTILSDDVARANFEATGNEDGKKGVVQHTMGLPSFLTREQNEVPVLLIYFIIFILAPPISVWLWWRNSQKYHASGLLKGTLQLFTRHMTENMTTRFIIEILAIAAEWAPFRQTNSAEKQKAIAKLEGKCKEHWARPKLQYPHAKEPYVLFHAYMLNYEIPAILEADMRFCLEKAGKVLDFMVALSKARLWIKPMVATLHLMQLIHQGLWVDSTPLDQLRFLTEQDKKTAMRKKVLLPSDMLTLTEERRKKYFPDHTDEEWTEMMQYAAAFPRVDLSYECGIDGEEGCFQGDIAKLQITLTRNTEAPEMRADQNDEKNDSKVAAATTDTQVSEKKGDEEKKVQDEDEDLPFEEQLDKMEVFQRPKKRDPSAAYVHSLKFPFLKRECWYVYVVQRHKGRERIVQLIKTECLADVEKLDVLFQIVDAGVNTFEIHAICDSYLGCNKMQTFTINAAGKEVLQKYREKQAENNPPPKPSGPPKGPFQYLDDMDPFWANMLDSVVMIGLIIGGYMWLSSKGYTQRYLEPLIDRMFVLLSPITNVLDPYLGPFLRPVFEYLGAFWTYLGDSMTVVPDEDADLL